MAVELARQLSSVKCEFGSSFGCYSGQQIMWVANGCFGWFRCGLDLVRCGNRYGPKNSTHSDCECRGPGASWMQQAQTFSNVDSGDKIATPEAIVRAANSPEPGSEASAAARSARLFHLVERFQEGGAGVLGPREFEVSWEAGMVGRAWRCLFRCWEYASLC